MSGLEGIKVGDRFRFWSERVFGVPVAARVTRVTKTGKLYVEAYFNGVTWRTRLHPDRIVKELD